MQQNIEKLTYDTFESIKQIDDFGDEFWYARTLSKILDYAEYRNFTPVIDKAKIACEKSGYDVNDHFVKVHEEIIHGKGATKSYDSYVPYLWLWLNQGKSPLLLTPAALSIGNQIMPYAYL